MSQLDNLPKAFQVVQKLSVCGSLLFESQRSFDIQYFLYQTQTHPIRITKHVIQQMPVRLKDFIRVYCMTSACQAGRQNWYPFWVSFELVTLDLLLVRGGGAGLKQTRPQFRACFYSSDRGSSPVAGVLYRHWSYLRRFAFAVMHTVHHSAVCHSVFFLMLAYYFQNFFLRFDRRVLYNRSAACRHPVFHSQQFCPGCSIRHKINHTCGWKFYNILATVSDHSRSIFQLVTVPEPEPPVACTYIPVRPIAKSVVFAIAFQYFSSILCPGSGLLP